MKKHMLIALILLHGMVFAGASLLPVGSESKKFLNLNLQNQHVGLRDYVGGAATKKVKAVVLSFWSTTCVPCRKEMPLVQAWAEKHKGDVELFFINMDKKSDVESVRSYVQLNKLGGTVLLDFYQTTGKAYGVCEGSNCSLPSLFVVDATGMVRFAVNGFDESSNLDAELEAAAFGPAPASAAPSSSSVVIPPATRLNILHSVLVGLPHDELAKKNGITREQLVDLLKEAEAAAKKQWGVQ
jgi:thiol-disulfide isomerase/thioredoxin